MKRFTLLRLKNEMLITNYVANSLGLIMVILLTYRSTYLRSEQALRLAHQFGRFFEPLWIVLMFGIILWYERPIRSLLNASMRREPIPLENESKARQRLLNEPFFLIVLDLSVWFMAAVFYALVFWVSDAGGDIVYTVFWQCLQTGLITSTVAFFVLRNVLQRRMVPHFFPEGGLYMTPKTFRIRISTRLAALIMACNLIPFFAIINAARGTYHAALDPAVILDQFRTDILIHAFIFMIVGLVLTFLMGFNLKRPFEDIVRVLQVVRNGDFSEKVRVISNDEIGYTGDVINEMTEGLKERDQMRHSLELAKEVQQNFMPKADPKVAGLDIAGRSRYCERTGGDYYDFLQGITAEEGRIGVVIGDVSGHGIPSALLMASARSSLRQRVLIGGEIGPIIADVNRQIARDVEDSGRFMTLFYTEIDALQRSISWVRAGHEPAIFYDPRQDTIEELKGEGMALGVDEHRTYKQYLKTDLEPGQIIVLATDGIWEAHDARGEMFGKENFYEIIRRHADKPANQILAAVYAELEEFQRGIKPEDDVTLVIIKIDR